METPKNLLSNQQKQQLPTQKKDLFKPEESSEGGILWKIAVSFLIGVVVGAIGVWISTDRRVEKETEKTTLSEENKEKAEETNKVSAQAPNVRKEPVSVSGTNAIATLDQGAGNTAEVTMITLSVPGWVAIHEDRVGTLGNILGARRFEPGIHLGEVELLRPMVSGGTYRAVLYQDLGEREFNSSEDAPIKDAEGKIIEAIFKAQ
ncbi:MAG: hypothetical protein AAB513_02435 [Patescibacteria group bacterium]